MSRALSDVVVLDATREFWASLGAAMLGDFGACVIRLDGTGRRREAAGSPDLGTNAHLELANRNKLSISLDLERSRGREVLKKLIAKADVFLIDWPRAAIDDARLDYEALASVRPDLIYATGSGFGPEGPDCDLPPIDELAAARTGMMPILPQPGQPPVYHGAGQIYSSIMLAFGVVTALWHRAETGEGQHVDASLFAGNMYGASLDLQAFLAIGGERFLQPVSRLDAGNPMSGTLYPTQDGRWVTLTMPDTDRWWPGLAEIVGLDTGDERFDSHEKRCEGNRRELIDELERAFQLRPAAHWRDAIAERNLSADVIEEYSFPANDEAARRNRYVIEVEAGKSLGFPLLLADSPPRLDRHAPFAGQHSAQVLSDLLGYSEDEIVGLEATGVVG
jgi:formyl-CoA transferase